MKNKVEIIKLDTVDESPQDNSAFILVAENKKERIAFMVDEPGK